jgi:hypothetical protein
MHSQRPRAAPRAGGRLEQRCTCLDNSADAEARLGLGFERTRDTGVVCVYLRSTSAKFTKFHPRERASGVEKTVRGLQEWKILRRARSAAR